MSITIRNEAPSEIEAIESLIVAAFADAPHTSHTEHLILKKLHDAAVLTLSLVVEDQGDVIGHVAVSPVSISSGARGWYGLGPVSVAPERQGRGIGTELIKTALDQLRKLGAAGCVVLGEPGYYGRFGFTAVPGLVLPDVPPAYFLALDFGDGTPAGVVAYHEAFNIQS